MVRRLSLALLVPLALLSAVEAKAGAPGYRLSLSVPLAGADNWDYLLFDQGSHRLFIAQGSAVTVVDGRSGRILGRVGGLTGAHGIALMPSLGRGYASNDGHATAFDLASLGHGQDIPADAGADAIVTDPATNHVFVMNGKGHDLTVIDPAANAVLATLPLGGKPEFAAADGKGALFVNIEDKSEVVRVDTRSQSIAARWSVPQCDSPHGLAMDPKTRRLFVSCVNNTLLVLDAESGRVVASLPIGHGSDAVAFDPQRKVVFSSNGDGTLSRFAETGADSFTVLPPVQTAVGARTMAVDPETGRVFMVTAEPDQAAAPGARRRFVAGTVKLMIFDLR